MWGVMVTDTLICYLPFYTPSNFILTDAVKQWAFHPFFTVFFGGGLLGFLYVVDYHEYDFWGAFFLNFS